MDRPTREDVLTEEELDGLLAQVRTRYPTGKRNLGLLRLLADSGLRIAEALALTVKDVISEHGQLSHVRVRKGKGGKARQVALTSTAAAKLAAWLQTREQLGIASEVLFYTISVGHASGHFAEEGQLLQPGRELSPNYCNGLVKKMAARAGIKRNISPHTLRHTFATRLLRATGNLEIVRKALGHKHISTTAIYSHLVTLDVDNGIRMLPSNGSDEQMAMPALAGG